MKWWTHVDFCNFVLVFEGANALSTKLFYLKSTNALCILFVYNYVHSNFLSGYFLDISTIQYWTAVNNLQ
jgi:hypothetical protein